MSAVIREARPHAGARGARPGRAKCLQPAVGRVGGPVDGGRVAGRAAEGRVPSRWRSRAAHTPSRGGADPGPARPTARASARSPSSTHGCRRGRISGGGGAPRPRRAKPGWSRPPQRPRARETTAAADPRPPGLPCDRSASDGALLPRRAVSRMVIAPIAPMGRIVPLADEGMRKRPRRASALRL